MRKCVVLTLVLCVGILSGCVHQQAFQSDVKTSAKPCSNLNFQNHPENFQFAIVADVNGGERDGVFNAAVQKLNLLQPEFVVCVGDLIPGYTEDVAEVEKQRSSFIRMRDKLDMPFFHVAGNHDITNPTMAAEYARNFGRPYYYFLYQDVLFLVLNTQDGQVKDGACNVGIGSEQRKYLESVLAKHVDVRWTFVFMHFPLWNEDTAIAEAGAEIEAMLKDRPCTMFAGHFHTYGKQVRNGRACIGLSVTGGFLNAPNVATGNFDQLVWVTMLRDGPRIANLKLEGVLDENLATAEPQTAATP